MRSHRSLSAFYANQKHGLVSRNFFDGLIVSEVIDSYGRLNLGCHLASTRRLQRGRQLRQHVIQQHAGVGLNPGITDSPEIPSEK